MGPTSVILGKFPIMATKQSVRGGWSGVATGVRRSRVPLVGTRDIRTQFARAQPAHAQPMPSPPVLSPCPVSPVTVPEDWARARAGTGHELGTGTGGTGHGLGTVTGGTGHGLGIGISTDWARARSRAGLGTRLGTD